MWGLAPINNFISNLLRPVNQRCAQMGFRVNSVLARDSCIQYYMSRVMRKPTFWFSTWSNTNLAVQLQKMARGLKFRIQKVEGLYYPCSENKGADQRLPRSCSASLFSHMQNVGFLMTRLIYRCLQKTFFNSLMHSKLKSKVFLGNCEHLKRLGVTPQKW